MPSKINYEYSNDFFNPYTFPGFYSGNFLHYLFKVLHKGSKK